MARKTTIKSAIRQLERSREKIAAERDRRRELQSDIEALADSADAAEECLSEAIDLLSQYA